MTRLGVGGPRFKSFTAGARKGKGSLVELLQRPINSPGSVVYRVTAHQRYCMEYACKIDQICWTIRRHRSLKHFECLFGLELSARSRKDCKL